MTWEVGLLQWVGCLAVTCVAGWRDFRSGRIPSSLTRYGVVLGCLLQFLAWGFFRDYQKGLLAAVLGCFACAVPLYLLWLTRVKSQPLVGGGDVRLVAAVGAILGARIGLALVIAGLLAATVWLLIVASWNGRLLRELCLRGVRAERNDGTAEPRNTRVILAPWLALATAVGALDYWWK